MLVDLLDLSPMRISSFGHHATDRLMDIVSDAAGAEFRMQFDVAALKKRGFLRILDAEEPHLPTCAVMIAELRAALEKN